MSQTKDDQKLEPMNLKGIEKYSIIFQLSAPYRSNHEAIDPRFVVGACESVM